MEKKILNIFIFIIIFLIITIIAISFIRIEKYENCLLFNANEQAKILLNKNVYKDISKNKNIYFLINKNSYNKKIIKFQKEKDSYFCIIEKIDNFKNQIVNISLKTKNKSIFDF